MMRTSRWILGAAALLLLLGGLQVSLNASAAVSPSPTAAATSAAVAPLRLMTWNVHHPNPDGHSGRDWDIRRDQVINLALDNDADVLGIQEASGCPVVSCGQRYYGASDLVDGLDHRYSSYPTADVDSGSPKLIFYRTSRFNLISSGEHAFTKQDAVAYPRTSTEDPCIGQLAEVGKPHSGRTMTWVVLEEKANPSQRYFVVNTHLFNSDRCWHYRHRAVNQIHSQIKQHNSARYPIVVMGDLNAHTAECYPGGHANPAGAEITNLTQPTYWFDLALDLNGSVCDPTFNKGWDTNTGNDQHRVDYIARTPDLAFVARRVDRRMSSNKPYSPSDHYPVILRVQP